jgi:hypothetical protein
MLCVIYADTRVRFLRCTYDLQAASAAAQKFIAAGRAAAWTACNFTDCLWTGCNGDPEGNNKKITEANI